MVIAELSIEAPMVVIRSPLPISIRGLRDAAGPGCGEPVEMRMTELQAKWLIEHLQIAVESISIFKGKP